MLQDTRAKKNHISALMSNFHSELWNIQWRSIEFSEHCHSCPPIQYVIIIDVFISKYIHQYKDPDEALCLTSVFCIKHPPLFLRGHDIASEPITNWLIKGSKCK